MTDEQIKAQAGKLAEVFAAALPPGGREKIAVEWAAFLAFELDAVAASARREALEEATDKAEEHCAELLEGMSQAARDDDSRTHDRLNHAYGEARHIVDDLRALKDSPAASVRGLVGEVGGEGEG